MVFDRFSKMAHLFVKNVLKLHGIPISIVSDMETKFVSYFWKGLCSKLFRHFKFSTSFHLQTNGQTEVVSRTLGNMLWAMVNVKFTF